MNKARSTPRLWLESQELPLKPVTIPRLEITAAVVSVRVATQLGKELRLENVEEIFWTDSKAILGYISNVSRRFHAYVTNRVQGIQDKNSPKQWKKRKPSQIQPMRDRMV